MMKDSHFFDDLAKMAGGAAGSMLELKRELEAMVSAQIEKLAANMQLVNRDEFETVRLMATKAREENEKLKKRLMELEAKLAGHDHKNN